MMDCPKCGGRLSIEEWLIWDGECTCLECKTSFTIELEEMQE